MEAETILVLPQKVMSFQPPGEVGGHQAFHELLYTGEENNGPV